MQKDNPGSFFSFISKTLFLGLLLEAAVYLIGALVILPILLIRAIGSYVWIRIEDRDTWDLEQARYRIWDEIRELEKEHRHPTKSGSTMHLYNRILELKGEADELTRQIQCIRENKEKDKGEAKGE